MASATMKVIRVWGGRVFVIVRDRREMVTRFMWMPGIRPVRVPVITPNIRGRRCSI